MGDKKMQIVYKKIDELKPYKNNPRFNDNAVEYVANSIREFGFKVPLVIDENNEIICGHTRLKASIELGLQEVPCIIADDLTEEQIKAFRIADNKVSERADWDWNLLNEELETITDIDMSQFDIDSNLEDGFSMGEEIKEPNERERTNDTYNLALYDENRVDGKYQMPIIENDHFVPTKLKGFNYMLTSEDKQCGIHFFVDDYQFERIWREPYKYVDAISQYECMLSPDFSLYLDMPMSMKIWNIYRSRLIGQFLQDNGVKVIPTISWAEEETFEFCFDGIPKGSIVAISTIGIKRNKENFDIWRKGVDAMIEKIGPSTILCYGGKVDYDFKNIQVIYYENEVTEKMKNLKGGE